MLQRSASDDAFHRLRLGSAAENLGVAALYATLLNRERQTPSTLIVRPTAGSGSFSGARPEFGVTLAPDAPSRAAGT